MMTQEEYNSLYEQYMKSEEEFAVAEQLLKFVSTELTEYAGEILLDVDNLKKDLSNFLPPKIRQGLINNQKKWPSLADLKTIINTRYVSRYKLEKVNKEFLAKGMGVRPLPAYLGGPFPK